MPFKAENVTFDFAGNTMKIKKLKIRPPEKSDIEERVKVMKDPPGPLLEDMVRGVK